MDSSVGINVSCRYISGQQGASEHKPTLEETVESLFRRLREKRQALGLPDNMKVSADRLHQTLFILTYILFPLVSFCNRAPPDRVLVCAGHDSGSDGAGEDHPAEMSAVL